MKRSVKKQKSDRLTIKEIQDLKREIRKYKKWEYLVAFRKTYPFLTIERVHSNILEALYG